MVTSRQSLSVAAAHNLAKVNPDMKRKQKERKDRKRKNRLAAKKQTEVRRQLYTKLLKNCVIPSGLTDDFFNDVFRLSGTDVVKIFRKLLQDNSCKRLILPRPFPKKYSQIGDYASGVKSRSTTQALQITFEVLRHFKNPLMRFELACKTFYRSVLQHELADARQSFETIEKDFGKSLWSLEAGLLLGELEDGVAGNRQFLSSVNEEIEKNTAHRIGFAAAFLTQRVELEHSVRVYEGELNWSIEDVKDEAEYKAMIAETLWRLSYRFTGVSEHAAFILDQSRSYSILDCYLSFRRLLPLCVAGGVAADELKSYAILQECRSVFGGTEMDATIAACADVARGDFQANSKLMVDLYDLYYRGNFNEVRQRCSQAIAMNPFVFEFYELAARATVDAAAEPDIGANPESLCTKIFSAVFECTKRSENMRNSMVRILKFAYVFFPLQFGQRLLSFWLSCAGGAHEIGRKELLITSTSFEAPWIQRLINEPRGSMYREWQLASIPDSVTAKLFLDPSLVTSQDKVNPEWVAFFEAAALESGPGRIASLQAVKSTASQSQLLYFDVVRLLISEFIAEETFGAAASEIVDAFLLNSEFLIGSARQYLIAIVEAVKNRRFTFPQGLVWPIILDLAVQHGGLDKKKYEYLQYASVDDFVSSLGHECVSDFLNSEPPSTPRLLYFLEFVCETRVMKRMSKFIDTESLEQERMLILQFILANASNRRTQIEAEIADLTHRSALRRAVQHVEAGRIYVNVDSIRNSMNEDHEKQFVRFRRVIEFGDEKLRKQFDVQTLGETTVIIFNDFDFSIFRRLFADVRDEFVSNKQDGLETYLSMRIRHGHLSAPLRGLFDNLSLVTRKIGKEYAPSIFWRKQLEQAGIPDADISMVDKTLAQFSSDVDSLIAEVNDVWIRSRTAQSDHDGQMLNFAYSDAELLLLRTGFDTHVTYEAFLDGCFDALWARTAAVLEKVRGRLVDELARRMTDLLSTMENDVVTQVPDVRRTEFVQNVARCRTDIQNEIGRIAEWFTTTQGPQLQSFTFSLLVDTATEYVRRIHPSVDFAASLLRPPNLDVHGDWFLPFTDMISNLFDNVIRHAQTDIFRPTVEFQTEPNCLELNVKNALADNVDVDALRSEIDNINTSGPRADPGRLQTEGKTGLVKVKKVVSDDLRQPSGTVTCTITDDGHFCVTVRLPHTQILSKQQ